MNSVMGPEFNNGRRDSRTGGAMLARVAWNTMRVHAMRGTKSHDGQGDVDVAAGRIGVRADLMGLGDQVFHSFARHARNRDLQLGLDAEGLADRTDADVTGDRGVGRAGDLF